MLVKTYLLKNTSILVYCQYSETDLQCSKNTCIYKELFDNKDVNCPFVGCVDEGGCDEKLVITSFHFSIQNKSKRKYFRLF